MCPKCLGRTKFGILLGWCRSETKSKRPCSMSIRPNRKISLGMKQTAPNPWDMVEAKYPSGTRIEGKVKSLTDFGAFIGLEEGIDGLIHISDMSWTKHIKHPSELFKKGQKVDAVVLRIDQ